MSKRNELLSELFFIQQTSYFIDPKKSGRNGYLRKLRLHMQVRIISALTKSAMKSKVSRIGPPETD